MSDEGSDITAFKMKRSASWQAREDFKALTRTIPLPIVTCWEVMQRFFVDSDIVESWTVVLNKLNERGEDFLDDRQRMDFISDSTIQFTKKATFELDPVSRLLIMGSGSEPDTINWNMRFPDCLFSNFKIEGTFGVIDGLPRIGKTSLGCSAMKILGEVFYQKILTNIVLKEPPEYVIYTPKLSDLITAMVQNKKFTAVLDETATYIYKKRALSEANIDFESLARFIGKWRGNLIMISHSFERDIPTMLQTWSTELYHKIALDKVEVDLKKQNGYVRLHKLISGVPNSSLEFVTEDTTSILFDISVSKLLNEIQDTDYRDKPTRIVEWITNELDQQNKRDHKKESNSEILEFIDDEVNDGLTLTQAFKNASEEYGLSPATIRSFYYNNKKINNR